MISIGKDRVRSWVVNVFLFSRKTFKKMATTVYEREICDPTSPPPPPYEINRYPKVDSLPVAGFWEIPRSRVLGSLTLTEIFI